jgi:hypothetical protein
MENFTESTKEQIAGARKILRRRNIGLLLMLLYVPAVAAIHNMTGSNDLAVATAILFMVAVGALMLSVAFARCPRCNNMFFTKGFWANGFALKCVHCGL